MTNDRIIFFKTMSFLRTSSYTCKKRLWKSAYEKISFDISENQQFDTENFQI